MNAYLVGGAVRDELLGLNPKDKDWVVIGQTPEKLLSLGFKCIGRSFPVFLHPKTKEEYALARVEKVSGIGHRGFVVDFSPDIPLEDDLKRRDLTINAIAKNTLGHYIDPFGGIQDLISGKFRHISDAFFDDPLRVLRVARFSTYGWAKRFTVDDQTLKIMQAMSQQNMLSTLSQQRIWIELSKALNNPFPHRFFEILHRCQALNYWLPELQGIIDNGKLNPWLKKGFSLHKSLLLRYAQLGYWCRKSSREAEDHGLIAAQQKLGAPKKFNIFFQWLYLLPNDSLSAFMTLQSEFWFQKFTQWDCWKASDHLKIYLALLYWRMQMEWSHQSDLFHSIKQHFSKIQKLFLKINLISLTSRECTTLPPQERRPKLLQKKAFCWEQSL